VIDVKQAIQSAKTYASEVLGIDDLLLDEVRSQPDAFDITLSFPERRGPDFVNPMLRRVPTEINVCPEKTDARLQ
jgi:hypothetical protein